MSPHEHGASSDLDAARLLLARLGVSPEELTAKEPTAPSLSPTFEEYIPHVAQAVSEGTRRAYSPYWQKIQDAWRHRRVDEPIALDIHHLAEEARRHALRRRNERGGRAAAEHLIAAVRCLYHHAIADGWIHETDNPARRVSKPRRLPTTRRALPDHRLEELNRVAANTGNDPVLDSVLLRLHTETACRRGGALQLRQQDLDHEQCVVLLREKGDTQRWQPISPTLMQHLLAHQAHRGPHDPHAQLMRFRNGHPLTARRYDHLWNRLGQHLPWVKTQQVSTHWLRHTTLTWVERHFGYAIARAYAGHTDSPGPGATATYIRADVSEVATALAVLTGEDHPLATSRSPGEKR